MSEDVSKLPKWAQNRIENLTLDLAATRKAMDQFAGMEKTAICIDPDAAHMRTGAYPRYLPERMSVEYKLQDGEIEVALRGGELRIMASGNGQLIVEPAASNVVKLRMLEDRNP